MKTAGVVENSGYCIYSIGLKCFRNCLLLFHLVFYFLQSNTRYFINHLERFTCHYIYIYIYTACDYFTRTHVMCPCVVVYVYIV